MTNSKNSVVIIGAGPTGCTAALLLAKLGIPCTLIERRNSPSSHPAAHVINARTLEVWAQIDPALAEEMFAASPSLDEATDIHWRTSLTGLKLGSINPLPEDPAKAVQLLSLSSYRTIHLGQHKVEPILWKWVEQQTLINFRKGVSAWDLKQNPDSVTAILRPAHDRDGSGPGEVFEARFAIACDGAGGRSRDALGINMDGDALAHIASVFFKAECSPPLSDLPVLAWLYNPNFAGVLINHINGDFILMTPYFPPAQDINDFDEAYWREAIPHALGTTPTNLKINSCGSWVMTAQVADHYRKGNIFLAGDCAHRFPPTGGYGLNTGVQDAHNLAWKLAAVLEDRANASLLDSYEIERKPVAEANCAQSVHNHFKMDTVTAPFKMTGRASFEMSKKLRRPPFSWIPQVWQRRLLNLLMRLARQQTRPLLQDNKRGSELRAKVAAEIPAQAEHFSAPGIEVGFAYTDGLVASEAGEKPIDGDGITQYRPTTWPGARMPHTNIALNGKPISNHLLLNMRDFLLICAPGNGAQWASALESITLPLGLSVKLEEIHATSAPDETWKKLFEVGEHGAVLIRPDGHVFWRASQTSDVSQLAQALNSRWPTPSTIASKTEQNEAIG